MPLDGPSSLLWVLTALSGSENTVTEFRLRSQDCPVSKEWNPANVFEVLASETAREVLVLASVEPMAARDLAEHCEASLPTIYRRVNVLVEYDLLEKETEFDPDGNHYNTYETTLDQLCIVIEDGDLSVDVQTERDLVDRFGGLWTDLERGAGGEP